MALRPQPLPESARGVALHPRPQPRQPVAPQLHGLPERLHQPSLRQVLLEHPQRQQRYPGTAGCRRGQCQRRIKHRPARLHFCNAGRQQPAWPLVGTVGAQQRHPRKIAWIAQFPCARWRAHRRERCIQHRRAHLPLPVAFAETDGQIQPFTGQIDPVVVGLQAQFDVRVAHVEIRQPWQQPTGGEGTHHANAQHLAIASGDATYAGADAIKRLVQHRIQPRPFLGQRHPARQPMEQHHPQPVFQGTDLVAEGRLADAQLQCCAGEILVSGGGLEGAQCIEGKLRAEHG